MRDIEVGQMREIFRINPRLIRRNGVDFVVTQIEMDEVEKKKGSGKLTELVV